MDSLLTDSVGPSEDALTEFLRRDPEGFLSQAQALLRPDAPPHGMHMLARMLCEHGLAEDAIAFPILLPLPEAITLARLVAARDPNLDVKLMRRVWPIEDREPRNTYAVARVLEVLPEISDGSKVLPLLVRMLRSASPNLQSKIVLLIGKFRRDSKWVWSHLSAADARVRANAVESLWGLNTFDIKELFRAATRDAHHRVAANGLVGLFLARDPEAYPGLQSMAHSKDAHRRAAAAWAIGRCGEAAAEDSLRELSVDPDAGVRRAALRALVQLRRNRLTSDSALSCKPPTGPCPEPRYTMESSE